MRKKRAVTQQEKNWKPAYSFLGIEITDQAVKAAEVAVGKQEQYRLSHHQIEPIPKGTVEDGRIKDAAKISLTLQNMLALMNTRTKQVHLALPSQLIMVRFLQLPDIPLNDLRKLIDFEVKHNIHLPFERPYYDFIKLNGTQEKSKKFKPTALMKEKKEPPTPVMEETTDASFLEAAPSLLGGGLDKLNLFDESEQPVLMEEDKLRCDVMLVAAPLDLIEEYAAAAQSAGLKPVSMEFKALSLYRVIEQTQLVSGHGTFVVLDVNSNATDLSIFHEGQLKITRSVPISFAEPQNDAQANQDDLFSSFVDPNAQFLGSCNDLMHEIERLMNFFRYSLNNRNHEFGHIVISADINGLPEIVEQLKVRFPQEIVPLFSPNIHYETEDYGDLFPRLAVPIGLALRGKQR